MATLLVMFLPVPTSMMDMMFTNPDRAFFSQAQRVALKPLGHEPLGDYIVSRFESTGKAVRPDALLGLAPRASPAGHGSYEHHMAEHHD